MWLHGAQGFKWRDMQANTHSHSSGSFNAKRSDSFLNIELSTVQYVQFLFLTWSKASVYPGSIWMFFLVIQLFIQPQQRILVSVCVCVCANIPSLVHDAIPDTLKENKPAVMFTSF